MTDPALVIGVLLACAGNQSWICDPLFAVALTVGVGVVYTGGVAYRMRGGE